MKAQRLGFFIYTLPAGLIFDNLSKLNCNNINNDDLPKLALCFVLFPDRGRAWWLLTGWLARKVLTKSYLTHHWTVVNWPCLKHWMFIMLAKLLTLIENQPSTEAFFARRGLDSTWSDDVIEQNSSFARKTGCFNSLIIFFKEGMACAQSIRKSSRTEGALLLGCDEIKLEWLHVNKISNGNKKRKRKNVNKLGMLHWDIGDL